jgi:hypothetical protein
LQLGRNDNQVRRLLGQKEDGGWDCYPCSHALLELNFAIAPHHVGGCCTKVAIPILMNDVDLKPSYVPIVTVEMSLHILNINVFIKMCSK